MKTKRHSSAGSQRRDAASPRFSLPDVSPRPPVTPISTQCSHIVVACGAPPFCFLLCAREAMAAGGWHQPLFVCFAASFDSSVGIRNAAGTLESFLTAAEWKRPPFVLPPPHQTNKHAMDTKTPANGPGGSSGATAPHTASVARRQKLHVFTQKNIFAFVGFLMFRHIRVDGGDAEVKSLSVERPRGAGARPEERRLGRLGVCVRVCERHLHQITPPPPDWVLLPPGSRSSSAAG